MPHREADPESIERAKQEIAVYRERMARCKLIKEKSADSVAVAMETIRDWEFEANYKKDTQLGVGTAEAAIKAHGFLGMQKAYQNVITLFEKPDDTIQSDELQVKRLEEWLASVSKGEQVRGAKY